MLRLAAAAALFLGLAHPAGAQVFSGSMLHNLSSDDSKAINAAVQSALASARVGGATRWTGRATNSKARPRLGLGRPVLEASP